MATRRRSPGGSPPGASIVARRSIMRPTERDIETTASGFYRLPCDGRHDFPYHFWLYYTKKEVIKRWREEHPIKKEK
jgi:hypothetical protein